MEFFLEQLKLTQFKNHSHTALNLAPKFNIFTGDNGMGKTNLLDAIHYLCLCKSHFSHIDRLAVQQSGDFFRLEGLFHRADKRHKVVCKYPAPQKKVLEWEGQAYERLAEHIGQLPLVIIAPDDLQLLSEGSERRRQYLDFLLVQSDPHYLQALSQYNRLLDQRHAFLKSIAYPDAGHDALLDVYDAQLLEPGAYLYQARLNLVERLSPLFERCYAQLCQGREQVSWTYKSSLQSPDWAAQLRASRSEDYRRRRSHIGPHRDDLVLQFEGQPLRQFASQGQRKSYLMAMRLAQYLGLQEATGRSPILLLDDIFDKLDAQRVGQLLELLSQAPFGQIFITDTAPLRLRELLEKLQVQAAYFEVKGGEVKAC